MGSRIPVIHPMAAGQSPRQCTFGQLPARSLPIQTRYFRLQDN
jgi:hypothetical protein